MRLLVTILFVFAVGWFLFFYFAPGKTGSIDIEKTLSGKERPTSFEKEQASSISENKCLPDISGEYAVWLWDSDPYLSSDGRAERLFQWLKANGIKTVFLRVDQYVDLVESGKDTKPFTDSLRRFLASAEAENLQVEALFGGPDWAEPSHRYLVDMIIDYVEKEKLSFVGYHLDIEPHGREDFEGNERKYLRNYLDMVAETVERLKGRSKKLSLDIPAWFDNQNKRGMVFRYQGKKGTVFDHLIGVLSTLERSDLTLMAYRRQTSGSDGTLALVRGEFDRSNEAVFVPTLRVGQEFAAGLKEKITHHGRKPGEIATSLKEIDSELKKFPAYAGIALHDAGSLKKIFPCR